LPTLIETHTSPAGLILVVVIGTLTLFGLAEVAHRLVGRQTDLIARERQISQTLSDREQQLSEMLSNNPAVLFRAVPNRAKDEDWHFQLHSKSALNILGFTAEAL
ncbi:MAG TPA: hypothetical protein PK954_02990, partial [Anaerolineales bacterium]|nr:hypothetical protein [Anaerolineales bacterium]